MWVGWAQGGWLVFVPHGVNWDDSASNRNPRKPHPHIWELGACLLAVGWGAPVPLQVTALSKWALEQDGLDFFTWWLGFESTSRSYKAY